MECRHLMDKCLVSERRCATHMRVTGVTAACQKSHDLLNLTIFPSPPPKQNVSNMRLRVRRIIHVARVAN